MTETKRIDYLRSIGVRESAVARANRETSAAAGSGHLQITPEQGQCLAVAARLIGARRALELGVYAGYSALWLGEALGPEGRLVAVDRDAEITRRARADWQRAGLDARIELRIDQVAAVLDAEIEAGAAGAYDLALIDADKAGYVDYYERCLTLVRPGGLIAADNTLWYDRVVDPDDPDPDTRAIRAFNAHVHADARVDPVVLPIGDGLTLARRR